MTHKDELAHAEPIVQHLTAQDMLGRTASQYGVGCIAVAKGRR